LLKEIGGGDAREKETERHEKGSGFGFSILMGMKRQRLEVCF